jgi:hypothetical protein
VSEFDGREQRAGKQRLAYLLLLGAQLAVPLWGGDHVVDDQHAVRGQRRDGPVEPLGFVRSGYFADLVAFDPVLIGAGSLERVYDQPGGADRLIARSTGVEYMWVNGVASRFGGADVPGAAAGTMLRG